MNDGTLREIKTLPVLLRGCGVYTLAVWTCVCSVVPSSPAQTGLTLG